MTFIVGWAHVDAARDEDAAAAMLSGRAAAGRAATIDLDHAFLGAASGSAAARVYSEGDLALAVDGRPYFAGSSEDRFWTDFRQACARSTVAAIKAIRGPFALAVYDAASSATTLAVDRMGVRPLAYRVLPAGGLIFGSTATAVAAHPSVPAPALSLQALYDYTYFHMVPSPSCIFDGIQKLAPGTLVTHRAGRVQVERYWHPVPRESSNADSLKDDLKTAIWQAVRRHDRESSSGGFLSGGLDSSTVCGVLRDIRAEPIPAYTISFASEAYDETAYAERAARHFGLDFRTYAITAEDIAASIPRIAAAYDEPFGNSSAVAVDHCAAFAKQSGTDVLLAGDGGDELFGGNERYPKQQLLQAYFRIPRMLRKHVIEPIVAHGRAGPLRRLANYVGRANIEMPLRMQPFNLLNVKRPDEIFEPALLEAVDTSSPLRTLKTVYDADPGLGFLRKMLVLDWKFTLADNDLRKVNRMCEINSVEVQYPLLDEDVIDVSLRVPDRLLVRRGELRWFFKEALRDFLPPSTLEKQKHGFGLPFGVWLGTSEALQEQVIPALASLKDRGVFRAAFIDEMLSRARQVDAEAYYGNNIWPLVMLEHWLALHAPGFGL